MQTEPAPNLRRTTISVMDLIRDIVRTVNRRPARTIMTSFGTILGVATAVATVGLVQSTQATVSKAFNAQLATQLTFVDSSPAANPPVLTSTAVSNLVRLNGVVAAGLLWQVDGGQPISVSTSSSSDATGDGELQMPVTAVTSGALRTMDATVSMGRLFDRSDQADRAAVALLGVPAAKELGIANVDPGPMIFVGSQSFTVIGIVSSANQQNQALAGVFIPTAFSVDVGAPQEQRMVIADTLRGAAPLIGRQGVVSLSPNDPSRINVEIPPQPAALRQQVASSVSDLLLFMSCVVIAIGVIAIANTTLFTVLHRRREIGVRRAVGATPRHIGLLVVGEAVFIGTIGGIVGTSIGILTVEVASVLNGWTPVLDWRVALFAPLIGVLAGGLAGAYPAWSASRVSPLAALRSIQ